MTSKNTISIAAMIFCMMILVACGEQNLAGNAKTAINTKQCSDSDGGLNFYVSGFVNTTRGVYADACTQNTLVEWTCLSNLPRQTIYACPQNCTNGACINNTTPPPTQFCYDSDGQNYWIRGYINSTNGSFSDSCSGTTLTEWTCSNNAPTAGQYNCPQNCTNGACINNTTPPPSIPPGFCHDTDGGLNYNVTGYVNSSGGYHVDTCGVWPQLTEWYCNNNTAASVYHNCARNCTAGRCV